MSRRMCNRRLSNPALTPALTPCLTPCPRAGFEGGFLQFTVSALSSCQFIHVVGAIGFPGLDRKAPVPAQLEYFGRYPITEDQVVNRVYAGGSSIAADNERQRLQVALDEALAALAKTRRDQDDAQVELKRLRDFEEEVVYEIDKTGMHADTGFSQATLEHLQQVLDTEQAASMRAEQLEQEIVMLRKALEEAQSRAGAETELVARKVQFTGLLSSCHLCHFIPTLTSSKFLILRYCADIHMIPGRHSAQCMMENIQGQRHSAVLLP